MKNLILTCAFLLLSTVIFSQKYMDEIVSKACDCFSSISDTLDEERSSMELGLCIIAAAEPYQKQLKKDYGIDFKNIDTEGEELGKIIGMKMAMSCPEALMAFASRHQETEEESVSENIYHGQVTKIKDDLFVEFSLKDEVGKVTKFYWFTFVESDIEMAGNYESLLEKNLQLTYVTEEFFDARIGEYRVFNIIQSLEIL